MTESLFSIRPVRTGFGPCLALGMSSDAWLGFQGVIVSLVRLGDRRLVRRREWIQEAWNRVEARRAMRP